MARLKASPNTNQVQTGILVLLRIAVGWHFLYEGLSKVLNPGWTSQDYLASASGLFSPVFQWMAETPAVLRVVDFLNMWGQIFVGLGLMLGVFTQTACIAGIALLALYYIANPPAYSIVNTNLVELIALAVLAAVPTGRIIGIDRLLARRRSTDTAPKEPEQAVDLPVEDRDPGTPLTDRREMIKGLAGIPFVVALGSVTAAKEVWLSNEEKDLVDAFSGASRKPFTFQTLAQLEGQVPTAKIGDKEVSRIILGGNIICGFAHARDLIYVSELVLAYHTPDKIYESLMLAEKCGINTILTHPSIAPAINGYWKHYGGKIQFLADCGWMEGTDTLGAIDYSIDHGATMCYLQGEIADELVEKGDWDYINKCIERVRDAGLPMGIGAHRINTLRAIAEKGISPDFWMKTFHHHDYWSAKHPEWHDNIYCYNPAETIEFMRERKEPWIAFKTMAAGSVHAEEAFRYAFESGADFICAGMYDFQMVEDSNYALAILKDKALRRERPWMA
jgi:uncharacterized membrane protein YphA (DoxX/SURF4 family)